MYPKNAFRPRRSLFQLVLAYLEITKASISLYASNIFHNLASDSDLRVCKCQYPPYKNWGRKVETLAEEIKAGGQSSWWQGDYKPNRTRTVIAIFESAMNK